MWSLFLLACVARSPVSPGRLDVASEAAASAPPAAVHTAGSSAGSAPWGAAPTPRPDALNVLLAGMSEGTAAAIGIDTREMTNAWKVKHNEAVTLLGRGDAHAALAAARASVALAPADTRTEPLIVAAVAASAANDIPAELAALELLADDPRVPWGALYNGSIDAAAVGRPDLANRHAQVALARTNDPATVAPMALRAALAAGDLDAALVSLRRIATTPDPNAVAQLARALSLAGRCTEAKSLDPTVCP